MSAIPEPSFRALRPASLAFVLVVASALLLATFAGDGSDVGGILTAGGAAVVVLAGALVAVAFGWPALPRLGWTGGLVVVAMLLMTAWAGVTVLWSVAPDRSWEALNRGVAFAAFLGLGAVLAGATRGWAARAATAVLAAVTALVLGWALLSKIVPSLDPDGDRVARLREPVEYWNALALLADVALVLGLWLGSSSRHRLGIRVGGGLLCYLATLALLLTLSRVGIVAAAAVVLLWLFLSKERVEGGLLLAAAVIPAGLVGAWAFTRPALVEDGATRSDRVADGAVLGVLAAVGAAAVVLLVVVGARGSLLERRRSTVGRVLIGGAALGVAAAVGLLAVTVGTEVSSATDCSEIANDPSRLGSLDVSNRLCWWDEALEVYAGNAPAGAGAGSFVVARKRYREDARNVVQPHSVPLQHLADGGIVGLGLFVVLVLGGGGVCVCAVRRLAGEERRAAIALVAAPGAYLLHALVDYDWDFLAVTAPTMFALGVLAGAGRPPATGARRPLLGVSAVLAALAVLVSFAAPRLADRDVRASTRALDESDFGRASDLAERARMLNPLAVEPLHALARVSERRGFETAAERRYADAVELQPENPETWYALGIYELDARENPCAAYGFLNQAYTLDPAGQQWFEGGPLDDARDAVNEGACEPR